MLTLDVRRPFSFSRTLDFVSRFTPCRDACILTPDALTAAVSVDGAAHAFTLRDDAGTIVLDVAPGTSPAVARRLRAHAEHLVGAHDDLEPLYTKATGDAAFSALVRELHGLHHVRFLTLSEAVVYSILMQRTPMPVAAAYKRRFLAALGLPVRHGGHTLHAMPELPALADLDATTIADAIGHRAKATRIVTAARAVHALGEDFLRTAPYDAARAALLAIDGIGPFSATAILLRGLGRMNALPWMPKFADAARVVYGGDVSEATITRRYGDDIGYWSFYVMTGAARRLPSRW